MTITQQQAIEALERVYADATHAAFTDRNLVRQYIEQSTAQPQAVVPAPNRTPGFDASTPTGRPSRDWYATKIHETLDDDFTIGSNAAAQPSAQAEPRPNRELLGLAGGSAGLNEDFWAAQAERAPVVQAVQATEKGNWWCAHCGVFVMPVEVTFTERHDPEAGGCGFSVSASSGATPADVRMLTRDELNDVALSEKVGWGPGEYVEAVQRKFCAINKGKRIPADGVIGGAT